MSKIAADLIPSSAIQSPSLPLFTTAEIP